MDRLILVGGGGHCKSCIDVIEKINDYDIVGILDTPDKIGQKVLGYKIIGTDDDIINYAKQGVKFLITVGQLTSADLRKKLYKKIKNFGGDIATIVSPLAYVSKHSNIGEGSIVMHGAIVNAGVNIGKNCIINTNALVEHDCYISDNCHIAVGAVLAGGITVENSSFIGANATLVQSLQIPPKSFIKAGTLVK